MPNQPPLNPDAVDRVAKALMDDAGYTWGNATEKFRDGFRHHARVALAVAQPVVNSVEELDALPYGSLITGSSGVTVMKYDGPNYDWITGNDYRYRMEEQEQCLPASVLYRPEVKP